MTRLDRRTFILGVAGAGVLTACGDDAAGPESGTPAFLQPTFPAGVPGTVLAAGVEQRLTFVLHDGVDTMRANAPASVEIEITRDGTSYASGPVPIHNDGILTPYYPVRFTPDAPGDYEVRVVDHPDMLPVPVTVLDRAEVAVVQVGDQMRPVDTPTVDDARGVDPICTRAVPCDFHTITLTEALASGNPTVLIISTPGFCQTDICGPVLELLIDTTAGRDDLAIVHAEVYADPQNPPTGGAFPETTQTIDTYALPYEPQLLVADAEGTIVARLDTMWDRTELADALALI